MARAHHRSEASPRDRWPRPTPDGPKRHGDVYGHRHARSPWTAWILLTVCLLISMAAYTRSLVDAEDAQYERDASARAQISRALDVQVAEIVALQHGAADLAVSGRPIDAYVAAEAPLTAVPGVVSLLVVDAGTSRSVAQAEPAALAGAVGESDDATGSIITHLASTLDAARDAGAPRVSAPFTSAGLGSDAADTTNAFAIALPFYSGGDEPGTTAERRAALVGWIVSLVDSGLFVAGVLGRAPGFATLEVFDGKPADTERIGGPPPSDALLDAGAARVLTTERDVLGRNWTLRHRAYFNAEDPQVGRARTLLLLMGLALSFLIFVIARIMRRSEIRAHRMVDDATRGLAESEERFRAVVENATDLLVVLDRNGQVLFSSPAGARLLGYDEKQPGFDAFSVIHPEDRPDVERAFAELLAGDRSGEDPIEFRALHVDGHWAHLEAVGRNLLDNPAVRGALVSVRDVSERKHAEAELHAAQERFHGAFAFAPIGMFLAYPDGRIFRVNAALCELLGRRPDELQGTSIAALLHPTDVPTVRGELARVLGSGGPAHHIEVRLFHADGHQVWGALSLSIVRDDTGASLHFVGQVEDVTERNAIRERLWHQSHHDPLTGLPNRVLFMDRLDQSVKRTARTGRRVAVVFLDLDRFKFVNDGLGHAAGDRLLVAVADRLRCALRPSDTVARFGGDEFVILCDDVPDVAAALEITTRLEESLTRPVTLPNEELYVTASLGVAISADSDDSAERLVRDADAAMYRAKDRGRARTELFEEPAHDRIVHSLQTGTELHHAIERRELRVLYQPIVRLETMRITGFEALVRWDHPERGVLLPDDFIGLAEETGLIVPIGEWVLEEACRHVAAWRQVHDVPFTMAVNISQRQLAEAALPGVVERTVADAGIDPGAIWLEVTETTLMRDPASAFGVLRALRSLGVHLGIDDFGTGYSSLSLLKRFPVEALKVDRTFVDGLGREPEDTAIVTAVVSLAHALGVIAIAEGVETPEQLADLRILGCEFAQGFLLGVPAEPDELATRIAAGSLDWASVGGA